jgi:hypothetical protein
VKSPPRGFKIVRKLDDGEESAITWRRQLSEAEKIVREIAVHWLGEYAIVCHCVDG